MHINQDDRAFLLGCIALTAGGVLVFREVRCFSESTPTIVGCHMWVGIMSAPGSDYADACEALAEEVLRLAEHSKLWQAIAMSWAGADSWVPDALRSLRA